MKKTALTALLVVALLTSTLAITFPFSSTEAAPSDHVQLSMPIEHINYTLTEINGALWAKIDGNYPISVQGLTNGVLPMAYPMPPNSTNIHLYLNGAELPWDNITAVFPEVTHTTAIGDWWQISALLENISGTFVLGIHYEHSLEKVNGSYMFLYDLNIVDYLSAEHPSSTAYFTIRLESNVSDVQVYTAPVDSQPNQWQPKEFTETTDLDSKVVTVEMHSQYGESLPGDLVVVFSHGAGGELQYEWPSWVIPVVLDVVLVAILIYAKRRTLASFFSSRKKSD